MAIAQYSKVDTGAQVTVITETLVKQLDLKYKLQPTNRILCGPDGNKLSIMGSVSVTLSNDKCSTKQMVYVLRVCIRAYSDLTIRELQVLTQVNQIVPSFLEPYSSLFQDWEHLIVSMKLNLNRMHSHMRYTLLAPCHYHYVQWLKKSWTEW